MILYGIPNCDTVKKARTYLEAEGKEFTFHDFRKDGLTQEKLNFWLKEVGLEKLTNKRSTTWKQLTDEQKANWSEESSIEAFLESPTLIKRPVLETGTQILIGFKEADYKNA